MDIGKFELDLADLAEAFESIDDPRSEVNRLHPLVSVLLMAVLSGAGGPTAIARWANMKSEWLLPSSTTLSPHGESEVIAVLYSDPDGRHRLDRRVWIGHLRPNVETRCS